MPPGFSRNLYVTLGIFRDVRELSKAAASHVLRLAKQQRKNRCFTLVLAGGSTPRELYRVLSAEPYRSEIPWGRVHIFWGDERCVPLGHSKSNFRLAQQALISQVPIPIRNIHRMPMALRKPQKIATAYERSIRRFFKLPKGAWPMFDLVLLGVGPDGHTASLFPASAALRERRRLAVAVLDAPDLPRITLTVPVFNHAKQVICIATGTAKARILRKVFQESGMSKSLPMRLVQPKSGAVTWYLDRAAARLIPRMVRRLSKYFS